MQLLKRIRHLFQPKALVLMYHRIAALKNDPWQLAVSPKNFEEQLQVLKKTATLIPLKELVSRLHKKDIPRNGVSLTFDDGYADNYLVAKPLLEKYQIPATFFIPSHYMGSGQPFWWDELEDMLLSYPELPSELSLEFGGRLFEFDLKNDSRITGDQLIMHGSWIWPDRPPTRRCELYLALWEKIRPLPFEELQSMLNQIKQWARYRQPENSDSFPMTLQQLKNLSAHALIDPGLHTVTHPALSHHSKDIQYAEISGNKEFLESIYGIPVDMIAYPYGNFNDTTLSVVQGLNIAAGFTTSEKIVSNLSDPLRIGRFQVGDWNGNIFENRLFKWKNSAQFL